MMLITQVMQCREGRQRVCKRTAMSLTERELHVPFVLKIALFAVLGLAAVLVAGFLDDWALNYFTTLWPPGTLMRWVLKHASYAAPWWTLLILALLLATHPRRNALLRGLFVCLGVCLGLLHLLKFGIGRARPELGCGPWTFQPFAMVDDYDAFPSGHVTQAVLLTVLCACYFPRSLWFFVPVAACTAVLRLVQSRHYLSDVIGAVVLVLLVFELVRWYLPGAFQAVRLEELKEGWATVNRRRTGAALTLDASAADASG